MSDDNGQIVALSTGIGIFTILLLYYFKLAHTFIGKPTDKIYYYLSSCICVFPPIFYALQLIDMFIVHDGIYAPALLRHFYAEWIIATPIFIIKLGQLVAVQPRNYLLLLAANELIFLSGYIFNVSTHLTVAMLAFSIAATTYIGILATLLTKYYRTRSEKSVLSRRTTHFSIYFTICIWTMYPTVSMLYKFGHIALTEAVIAYVVLDILAKGIFTCILIGSRELAARRQSLTAQFAQHVLRIRPLELDTETSIATNSVDDFCRRVDIDGGATPT